MLAPEHNKISSFGHNFDNLGRSNGKKIEEDFQISFTITGPQKMLNNMLTISM